MKELYLVTGGFGYLGNTIVKKLIEKGKKVRVLVLPSDKTDADIDNIEKVNGDVLDVNSLEKFFSGTEDYDTYVIHCAGIVSIASKHNDLVYDVNVNGTKNITDMCIKHNIKRLIHISSVHAIEEKPKGEVITEVYSFNSDKVKGLYANTKAEATQYVMDKTKEGLDAVVIHPSGIVGPNDYGRGHLTQLIIDYSKGTLTAYVDGGYDFVDVRDVADGIISSVKNGRSGEGYILSNRYFKVKELLDIIAISLNKKKIKVKLPLWFAKLTAPIAETYYKLVKQPPLYTPYSLYTLSSNSIFSHKKADKELDYRTRPMEESVRDTIKSLRKQQRI
jgi:dihydroflavonol-4-reductase